jgi:hypothetical protein
MSVCWLAITTFALLTFLSDMPGVGYSGQASELVGLLLALGRLLDMRPLDPARPFRSLLNIGCLSRVLCGLRSGRRLAVAIGWAIGLAAGLAALVRASLGGGGSKALRCGPLGRSRGSGGDVGGAIRSPRQFGGEHRKLTGCSRSVGVLQGWCGGEAVVGIHRL